MRAVRELAGGEKRAILAFLAAGGHVLDLSRERFDVWSAEVIGCGLYSKQDCADGEALRRFVSETGHAAETLLLLRELLTYYRERFPQKVDDGSECRYSTYNYNRNMM